MVVVTIPCISQAKNLGLGVALSVGELRKEDYQRLWDSGAHRYLLRIEVFDLSMGEACWQCMSVRSHMYMIFAPTLLLQTSNPDLFATLHPVHQRWDERVQVCGRYECRFLK